MTKDQEFYALFQNMQRPVYPFPNLISPFAEEMRELYYHWIDTDYNFHSEKARETHKKHVLTDIAARGLPLLKTLDELFPIASFAANGAMMDDYFDHCNYEEMYAIRARSMALLNGQENEEPTDFGIFRQFYLIRQRAIKCGMPPRLYDKFIASIHNLLIGYQDEKRYMSADTIPPFPVYLVLREDTSGGLPFCKYVAMQKDFRTLPDAVLEHPHILRLHTLAALMIGVHNDLISLPKELNRKGDVINIVKVIHHENDVSWEEAYKMALDFHDKLLNEFTLLHEHLPNFGPWQALTYDYVLTIGIMIQGVYAWHTNDKARYVPGGYVEPEYQRPDR
ncbi:terpene synthase family protein [Olivibacter sp. CPCC 100613]|uniref:terpene synthase family protein n=1 Tax=Olivibacter sp. CPCC 100613 TaxID=3079931 RepID=UPI002FF6B731